jgi:hypothetical protein
MLKTRDRKLRCSDGLWRHLHTELLYANLVHLVVTAEEVQWIVRQPSIAN